MRISDWSSDVCSSDLAQAVSHVLAQPVDLLGSDVASDVQLAGTEALLHRRAFFHGVVDDLVDGDIVRIVELVVLDQRGLDLGSPANQLVGARSEEHTSELQSLMRISYAVFSLKKK